MDACPVCLSNNFQKTSRASIKCSSLGCVRWTHASCLKLSYAELKKRANSFKCKTCEDRQRDITSQSEVRTPSAKMPNQEEAAGGASPVFASDTQKLDYIIKEISRLKNIEDKLGELGSRIELVDSRVTAAEASIVNCQQNLALQDRKSEEILQYLRKDNLEINGIPEQETEDLWQIFEDLSKAAGYHIPKQHIQNIHRVPTKIQGKPKPIIVKLLHSHHKKGLLAAKPRLETDAINIPGDKAPIFIADHLTPYQRQLFADARSIVRKLGGRDKGASTWVFSRKIYLKVPGDTRGRLISTAADLAPFQRLTATTATS